MKRVLLVVVGCLGVLAALAVLSLLAHDFYRPLTYYRPLTDAQFRTFKADGLTTAELAAAAEATAT